ncbi:MAG TPA: phosphate signaling complex protein PhoU [Spirochaetia bacterium]|nr:phosphate signaling complex protein PhoU [Spirochaetales bacterium]HRS66813.1 phosphate signaling complex protein PhoU [Spirochaetia bacterium]HOT59006.1 phosphate signaling complex protein PhoU [Spirochaetales bacterium]HPD80111.1 phosphate signaling complex protein PhoU [Spirochaetales bacterium]HQK33775.1 phosphate signaling complex protein PhoU [Spirochaetales bacterium]
MTRQHLAQELDSIRSQVLSMSLLIVENLRKARECVINSDPSLISEIKRTDLEIDALQLSIEDSVTMLIATQQPAARDLREMVALIKILDNLERIGDYAVHFAKASKILAEDPFPRPLDRLIRMSQTCETMLDEAIKAYLNQNESLAVASAEKDDVIDRDHKAFLNEILSLMVDNPARAGQAFKLIQTSTYLERLGDHVTNITEAIVFIITGEHKELNA